jgi:tetratricopeptide (TPR) repeat protein
VAPADEPAAPPPTAPATAPPAAQAAAPAAETPASVPAKPAVAPGTTERVRPGRAARAAAAAAADAEAATEGSYEQLVLAGDKALENGASNRALRLFDRALKLQPDGAEALAGLGYVNLDRHRAEAAISYFRRALTVSPYAPAMFGLGEAYRALGDKARALDAYQRYLSTSPTGADAPAARRQLKALGESEGPPPTPATILREGAAE